MAQSGKELKPAYKISEIGSVWAKWDLHVHSPNTRLSNAYRSEHGADPWVSFCDKIEASDVRVLGITDYFSADNYFAFIERFQSQYPNSDKVFFPNVELRLEVSVGREAREVNIHVIFDNEVSSEKIQRFLSTLKTNKTKNGAAVHCCDLDQSDVASASVSYTDIRSKLNEIFGKIEPYLIVTAANNDGIRSTHEQRKMATSDEIDKMSDAFFGNRANIDYFMDVGRYEDEDAAEPKPVITGSDAHSFDDLDNYLGKQATRTVDGQEQIHKDITWIKASPTFTGLKQMLYEPRERVAIGSTPPDIKDDFRVIDRLLIRSKDHFPEEIAFNPNLCSIIGTKSSGKSTILSYLGFGVDPQAALERNAQIQLDGPAKGISWQEMPEVEVVWRNGHSASDSGSSGKLIYVPQNYLIFGYETDKQIEEMVLPTLFSRDTESHARYNKFLEDIQDNSRVARGLVDKVLSGQATIRALEQQLKDKGSKRAIEQAIAELEAKMKLLVSQGSLSPEELTNFQKLRSDVTNLNTQLKSLESDQSLLANAVVSDVLSWQISIPVDLSQPIKQELNEMLDAQAKVLQITVSKLLNEKVAKLKLSASQTKKQRNEMIAANQALIQKAQRSTSLQEHDGQRTKLQVTLSEILRLEAGLEVEKTTFETSKQRLSESIKQKPDIITSYAASIACRVDTDMQILSEAHIDKQALGRAVSGLNFHNSTQWADKEQYVRENELVWEHFEGTPTPVIEALLQGELVTKVGTTIQGALYSLCANEVKIASFSVKFDGDSIGGAGKSTMTPGKRALACLKLLLGQSDETWPLLIDQPEDSLDSRSIFTAIVPYLRQKKSERQIIMVTHDANLTVGADAEQVIVANQNGKDRPNANGITFNYLSGGLEDNRAPNGNDKDILKRQGIKEHVCEVLEGGEDAFKLRQKRYKL